MAEHTWTTNEDGDIEYYEFGDFHGGPICAVCEYSKCLHCARVAGWDVFKLDDCPGPKPQFTPPQT